MAKRFLAALEMTKPRLIMPFVISTLGGIFKHYAGFLVAKPFLAALEMAKPRLIMQFVIPTIGGIFKHYAGFL